MGGRLRRGGASVRECERERNRPPGRLAFRFASCYCAGMEVKLCYRGRSVTEADIAFIRHLIAEHPTASRRLLSKKLCAAWHWGQPNGARRAMVSRGLSPAITSVTRRRWAST